MKLLLLYIIALKSFSAVASSDELDVALPAVPQELASTYELDPPSYKGEKKAKLFVSMFEDGFSKVKAGDKDIWTKESEMVCDFVKVLTNNGTPEALKLGLKVVTPGSFLRVIKPEFHLKKGETWTKVERDVYVEFLKTSGHSTLADRNYETDETFDKTRSDLIVDTPVGLPDRETSEVRKEGNSDLPKSHEEPSPSPNSVDTPRPSQEVVSPNESHKTQDVLKTPLDKDDTSDYLAEKVNLRKGSEESSFITTSLLLPAMLVLLYTTH